MDSMGMSYNVSDSTDVSHHLASTVWLCGVRRKMKVDKEETWMYLFTRQGRITRIGYSDRPLTAEELEPLQELMSRPEFNGFRLLHDVLYVFDSCSPDARITGDIIEEKWRYVNLKKEVIDGGDKEKKR